MTRFVKAPAVLLAGIVAGLLVGLVGPDRELIPLSILAESLPQGLLAALYAVGLVLVYRAARIINFAHASFGVVASLIFITLLTEGWSWWVAAPAGLLAAVLSGLLVEVAILRRFANAPRLVVTVATIAAGQLLVSIGFLFPRWRLGIDITDSSAREQTPPPNVPATSPFSDSSWSWDPTRITGDHVLAVVLAVVVLIGLAIFLRRSTTGTAIRAASENTDRVAMLGISTGVLGSVVWGIAAGLAGLAAIASAPLDGDSMITLVVAGSGTTALLRALAASVIARLEDIPTAIAASVGIAAFERCVFWAYRQTTIVDVALLLVIGVALALQRRSLSRADVGVTGGWAAAEEVRPVPAVLAAHPTVKAAKRWAIVVGAAAMVIYPFAMSPSQVYLGSTYAIFGMIAISLVVLTGWGGQISLGQFSLVAVGAMVAGIATTTWGLPFIPAMVLATVAGAGVAVLLGLPALRIQGLFLAVTTLSFAVALLGLMTDRDKLGRFLPQVVDRPKLFVGFDDERAFYFLCLGALALTVVVAKRLRTTRTGRVLIAMRDNERAAQSFSLSLLRVRLATFAIAGAMAAAAGGLLVHQQHGVRLTAFSPEASLQMFLMAVIGGLGSVGGVLTGAIYLGTVQTFVSGSFGRLLASGGGVLLILIFFPGGLGGLVYRARDAFLRRIALREKIWVPSILGDVRTFDPTRSVAPLAPKTDANGSRVKVEHDYELDSTIEEAGRSQAGKGWIYA